MIKYLTDLIIPNRCFGCNEISDNFICPECLGLLKPVKDNICQKCGKPSSQKVDNCLVCRNKRLHFDIARSLVIYEGKAIDIIKGFKYQGGKYIPSELYGNYLEIIDEAILDCDFVTFVPSGVMKYLGRGYNPAQEAAFELSGRIKKPCFKTLLYKRMVKDQTKLNRAQRSANISGSMICKSNKISGKNVLLVDDVLSTFSTVNEAAAALKKEGAGKVNVLTLARNLG